MRTWGQPVRPDWPMAMTCIAILAVFVDGLFALGGQLWFVLKTIVHWL